MDPLGGKARFWPWVALPSDGDPISEEVSGFQRIFVDYMGSNQALEGSAYWEQWVSNSAVCQPKPRNPFTTYVDPSPGFKNIPTVLGPMARSVEDIELASRVVFGRSADYSSVPVPYREVKPEQKLKFGYYFNDGMARITPACHRAVSETVEALRKQGHECVEFELPSCVLVTRLRCVSEPSHYFPQLGKHLKCLRPSRQHSGIRNSSEIKAQIQRCGLESYDRLHLANLFPQDPSLELVVAYVPREHLALSFLYQAPNPPPLRPQDSCTLWLGGT